MNNNNKRPGYISKDQLYESLADAILQNNSKALKDIIYSVAEELGYAEHEFHYADIADRVTFALAVDICRHRILQKESLTDICRAHARYIMKDILNDEGMNARGTLYIDGFLIDTRRED